MDRGRSSLVFPQTETVPRFIGAPVIRTRVILNQDSKEILGRIVGEALQIRTNSVLTTRIGKTATEKPQCRTIRWRFKNRVVAFPRALMSATVFKLFPPTTILRF